MSEEEKPIAQACIRNGDIWFYFDNSLFAKVTVHSPLGAGLFDFIWLDEFITSTILNALYARYQAC